MITTIKEQINCMLNRKEQLDLDQWPMMIFFFFFVHQHNVWPALHMLCIGRKILY